MLHSLHKFIVHIVLLCEGTLWHYGRLLLRFSMRSFGVHVWNRVTFQWLERMYRCFQSVYFEIMTWVLGNNLNVFIVFCWNKSLKLTVWKVHSQIWQCLGILQDTNMRLVYWERHIILQFKKSSIHSIMLLSVHPSQKVYQLNHGKPVLSFT